MRNLGTLVNNVKDWASGRARYEHQLAREVIAELPKDELRSLQAKHQEAIVKGARHRKYLQLERHMERAVRQATTLRLHKVEPLYILDIGCGAGYSLAVARHLGHHIMGLDKPDSGIFNDFTELMAIPRVMHTIEPFTPLPEFATPFNLITGFQVRFNWINDEERWGFEEWHYFLDDCRSRLAPGGRVHLELNPGKTEDYRFLPEETTKRLRELQGVSIPADKKTLTVQA
jgi:SAM-dependent methyltransferase